MSRVIRIDRDVHAELERRAEPGETRNDTVRRLLGLPTVGDRRRRQHSHEAEAAARAATRPLTTAVTTRRGGGQ